MFSYDFAVQNPGNGAIVLRSYIKLSKASDFDTIMGAFAYATDGGAKLLTQTLSETMPRWQSARKTWLVSFDFGLTEPEAIDTLLSLPNSEVRIANAEEVLSRRLKPNTCFHPKTVLLSHGGALNMPMGIASGSANLTISGLSFGYENICTALWCGRLTAKERTLLSTIHHAVDDIFKVYQKSAIADRPLLRRYVSIRPRRVRIDDDNPLSLRIREVGSDLTMSKASLLATSRCLWVRVEKNVIENRNRLPGNQIDLQRGTRVFFGFGREDVSKNTVFGTLHIKCGTVSTDVHMRFAHNGMDRLNLPFPENIGLASYSDQTLLFERQGNHRYSMKVGNAKDSRIWKEKSDSQNSLFSMKGGRQFGVFN
jgi:HKD family nuclease